MILDRIEIFHVRMPLVYPFRTAFGNNSSIGSVLVRLHSGGAWGWGEASPWGAPAYSPEHSGGSFLVIRDFLAPLLINQDVKSGENLQALLSPVKGNFFAKAALDNAWWDLEARRRGIPLYRLLGGKRSEVEVGADFGIMESIPLLLDTVGTAVDQGYKRIKLKYRPGWELDMIAAVRERFPDTVIHVDCNSAYTLDDLSMLRELENFNLAMIEQPLMHDDLVDHAALQRELNTPICLDESITSVHRARKAIELDACRWVNIKPGRVGGLTNAVAIHNFCMNKEIPCWVGGMLESSLGAHQCLALATLPNFTYPADIFPSERFYTPDMSFPEMRLSSPSMMKLPDIPGSGAEPDMVRLQSCLVETVEVDQDFYRERRI